MKKFELKTYSRAIELVGIIIGLYLIRGIWTLTGFWNTNDYFQFEVLRLLVSGILVITLFGFIRKKMVDQPKVQRLFSTLRVLEGIQIGVVIMSLNGIYDWSIPVMVSALATMAFYIYALIVVANAKYNSNEKVKYLRYFFITVIAIDCMYVSIGLILAFSKLPVIVAIQYFIACISPIVLIWYLKNLQKIEETPKVSEEVQWQPE